MKPQLINFFNIGKYDEVYKCHITELILIIADKHFPSNWPDLNLIFAKFFEISIENLVQDQNNFNLASNLTDLFYKILKQNNKKRIPSTRSKFLQYKANFINSFCPFYENVLIFFNENSNSFNNIDFATKYLNLMKNNDKILLILIDSCFNINDFHKDEKLMIMLKTILDRAYYILNQIDTGNNNNTSNSIKQILNKNIFKIIKNLAKTQASNAIIFYKDLERYVNMLLIIIINCNLFESDCLKVVFFALCKVINTATYKELLPEDFNNTERRSSVTLISVNNNENLNNNILNNNNKDLMRTPEKPRAKSKAGISVLVSPTKFKNHECEVTSANETFANCFKEEVLRNLLENMIKKVPFIYQKETEGNLEIELLADIEEEMIPTDSFSTNTMSWQMLYKNFLESIISNFSGFSLKYIKEVLEILYTTSNNNNENNILLIDSIIYLVNLLPALYKTGVITELEMIDYSKFISYIEQIVPKSEMILKKYIVTISKWADVLISNDTVYTYLDNLLIFLNNSKVNVILIECCLAVRTIVTQLDKFLKNTGNPLHSDLSNTSGSLINVYVDKKKLQENIKNRIDWSNLLYVISNVCLSVLPYVKNCELLLALINLFTSLIQKCHYQCDGKILHSIQNSKLIEIIQSHTEEFAQHAFIDMWRSLLVSFSSSSIIVDLSLQYASSSLKKDINTHNLNFLLFLIKIIDKTDEIRNLILYFLKDHISMFQSSKQSLSITLFNILEEIVLFDIFEGNDIGSILNLCVEKYIPTYDLTKDLYNKHQEEKLSMKNNLNQRTNENYFYGDLAEYKSSIAAVASTTWIYFFNNKNISLIDQYRVIIRIFLEEINISFDGPKELFTTTYLNVILPFINRISILEFEFFKNVLNEFLNERQISFQNFYVIWLNRMEHMISIEARKLNVISICKFMPMLDRNTFINNLQSIFHICLITVHSDMMKKIDNDNAPIVIENPSVAMNTIKNLSIRHSIRKKMLSENDPLLKIDVHSLFVQSFKVKYLKIIFRIL